MISQTVTTRPARTAGPAIALDHMAVRHLLPHRPALLMVDRVRAYLPQQRRLVAYKNLSQNEPFIQGHFPEFPIFPGVLIVEALLQACTILMHLDGRFRDARSEDEVLGGLKGFVPPLSVLAESRVKHIAPSFPGDHVELEVELVGNDAEIFHFKVKALTPGGETASQGRLSLARTAGDLTPGGAEGR